MDGIALARAIHKKGADAGLFPDAWSLSPASACRRCGRLAATNARFCGNCGLRLKSSRAREQLLFLEAMSRGKWLRERGTAWQRLAIRIFRGAMQRHPGVIEPILEIARTYRMMCDPRRATRWYRRAVRRKPDCVEAWIEGANNFGRYDHFRRARWLCRAVALRPADRSIADELNRQFVRLTRWQRWWIERTLWRHGRIDLYGDRESGLC